MITRLYNLNKTTTMSSASETDYYVPGSMEEPRVKRTRIDKVYSISPINNPLSFVIPTGDELIRLEKELQEMRLKMNFINEKLDKILEKNKNIE